MLTAMAVALLFSSAVALAAVRSGTVGNDTIRGTRGADQLYGIAGSDTLYGFAGEDELYGGAGNDDVYGGYAADEIYGGSGADRLFGGPGNDYINSADNGRQDIVDCGDGVADTVVADGTDSVNSNCERL